MLYETCCYLWPILVLPTIHLEMKIQRHTNIKIQCHTTQLKMKSAAAKPNLQPGKESAAVAKPNLQPG